MGFSLTGNICDIVQKVVQDGRINNGRPGHLWFKGLCAETQKKRKRSLSSSMYNVYALTSKRWKEVHEADEQESLLKEKRKEKERYKVVRKERERGRKSKQMKMTGNAEHVTHDQASLKMRKMEINASGYSACDKCKEASLACFSQTSICVLYLLVYGR